MKHLKLFIILAILWPLSVFGINAPGGGVSKNPDFESVSVGTTGSITEETNTMTFDDGDGLPITLQDIRNATGGADTAAIHDNQANEITAITAKATPADADELLLEDSAASYVKKALTWANIKATLKAYFDSLYSVAGALMDSGTDNIDDTHINWGTGAGQVSMDDIGDGSTNAAPTLTQESNWDTAYGWGDHSSGGYQADLDIPSQAEAEAGTATTERVWTSERVGQAIAAQAGGGTDDQTIDVFSLDGTTLSLSLESDGEATKEVDLSGLQDGTGTDDQTIDSLSLEGTILSISIEGDDEEPQTVDLSGLQDGTGTDDQTATEVQIADAGEIISATNVELALAENRTAINLNTAKETNTDDQNAGEVSCTDEFDNSNATNVQDVLDDLDAAIAGGGTTLKDLVTTSPLSGGTNDILPGADSDVTLSIADAAADGSTKGAASFTANDFDATSGNISLDYTNAQKASTDNIGFLTDTDWNTFNSKQDTLTAANVEAALTNDNIDFGSGVVTATGFSGPLTGNVTGDASGSSGSCTGNAATATLATTATTANAGDSATAFFSSGTIEAARIPFAAPGAIGGTTPAAGTFTTLTCSSIASSASTGDRYIAADNDTTALSATTDDVAGRLAWSDTDSLWHLSDGTDWNDYLVTNNSFASNTETGIAVTPQSDGTVDFVVDFTDQAIGASTATTPAENDNDTSVATTAYVQTEISGFLSSGGNIGAATATTPNEDDNDTSVATTAYVQTEISGLGGDAVTLNASATTGGMSLTGQEISFRAATNAQTGYATAAHITAIETNTAKTSNAEHTGDVTGSTALTIASNSVALGTDTTGNYVATIADSGDSCFTVANSGSEAAAVTLDITDGGVKQVHLANICRSEFVPIGWFNDGTSAPSGSVTDEDNISYLDFPDDSTTDMECTWLVPSNLTGSAIKVRVIGVITNATAPADTEGVSWGISACSSATNENHDCTLGTEVYSEDTDLDDNAGTQWDYAIFPYVEVTPTGLAAGELLKLAINRDHDNTDDTYGQDIGLIGIEIKWQEDPGTMTY